jgi:hypothetical protein
MNKINSIHAAISHVLPQSFEGKYRCYTMYGTIGAIEAMEAALPPGAKLVRNEPWWYTGTEERFIVVMDKLVVARLCLYRSSRDNDMPFYWRGDLIPADEAVANRNRDRWNRNFGHKKYLAARRRLAAALNRGEVVWFENGQKWGKFIFDGHTVAAKSLLMNCLGMGEEEAESRLNIAATSGQFSITTMQTGRPGSLDWEMTA